MLLPSYIFPHLFGFRKDFENHDGVAAGVRDALGGDEELVAGGGDGHSDGEGIGADGAEHFHIAGADDADLADVIHSDEEVLAIRGESDRAGSGADKGVAPIGEFDGGLGALEAALDERGQAAFLHIAGGIRA